MKKALAILLAVRKLLGMLTLRQLPEASTGTPNRGSAKLLAETKRRVPEAAVPSAVIDSAETETMDAKILRFPCL